MEEAEIQLEPIAARKPMQRQVLYCQSDPSIALRLDAFIIHYAWLWGSRLKAGPAVCLTCMPQTSAHRYLFLWAVTGLDVGMYRYFTLHVNRTLESLNFASLCGW